MRLVEVNIDHLYDKQEDKRDGQPQNFHGL